MTEKGMLYLVATPIGNLEDITLRALRILREVDLIAAEDTRQTIKLLNHFEIKKQLVSYHEHNKIEKGNHLVTLLEEGKNIALVSDAGSPGISDPGEELVKLCAEKGIKVTMTPGPAAVIMGLVVSGLPTGRFAFEGFLPMNKRSRKERLSHLVNEVRTLVFYEAPHKLQHTLKDLNEHLGNRQICLARELTKKFEEVIRFDLEQAIIKYENETPKGEFVIIVEGADEKLLEEEEAQKWNDISLVEHVNLYINQGIDKKEAIKKVAVERSIPKREVYDSVIKSEN